MTKHVHFMGIAGSGASACAAIAQFQGFEVTGCDKNISNEFTKPFKLNQLQSGHSASHLTSGNSKTDMLVVTPAIFSLDPDNIELLAAKKKKIPILTWQQFMGKYLLKDKFVIAVAGTHGKSTTTAMIALLLEDAGLDPTAELGAIIPKWGSNFRIGKSKYFIVEADEFNDNFLNYAPDITVITNIEMDHPEYFKNIEHYKNSFYKFLLLTKNAIVVNLSDSVVSQLIKHLMKNHASPDEKNITYLDDRPNVKYLDFSKNIINFPLKVAGEHNKLNASAAVQVGLLLGINSQTIQDSLANYQGIGRRFEYLGKFKGADVYSDFGHHPTEIKVTIGAARKKFPNKKLWLIFEPHMFSRTKALFDDFVRVFRTLPADQIIILDIYPSREVDTGKVKSWQIVQSVKKGNVRYASPEEIREVLNREIQKGDVIFFMGAGDIDKMARKLTGI